MIQVNEDAHAPQRQRHQGHDDERVEDHGREDRAFGACEPHHVQRFQARILRDEDRRQDGEVLRDVVGDREGGQRAARDEQLLADLHHLDELRRIAVEVHHVAGLARRLRAGLHGEADIGLGPRRRVVGAVAGHRDQTPFSLGTADIGELVLGRRLGEEVIHARQPMPRSGSTPAPR